MKLFSLHRYVSVDMETLLTLQEIAKQLKRLADAWEVEPQNDSPQEPIESRKNKYWTDSELEKAIRLSREGKSVGEISEIMPGRSPEAIHNALARRGIEVKRNKSNVKYPTLDRNSSGGSGYNRKDMWTEEEDGKLLLAVQLHGTKWREIVGLFEGRTTEALQSRYKKLSKNS